MCEDCDRQARYSAMVVHAREEFLGWLSEYIADRRMLARIEFGVAFEDYQRRLRRARRK